MRIVLRVLEYVWYPLFLSIVVFTACKLGALDTGTGQAIGGWMIVAFAVWKLCELILRETLIRQAYLILAFLWLVGVIGNCIFDPNTNRSSEEINRQVWIAWMPLLLGVKYVQINERSDS